MHVEPYSHNRQQQERQTEVVEQLHGHLVTAFGTVVDDGGRNLYAVLHQYLRDARI